jgi:folate-dependent phosphoribosylglycinamide formyltransferase PurN
MKIVILAQDSASTWMMVNALRHDYPELKVLIEQGESRATLLRRRAARKGFWEVFGQVLFMSSVPLMCASGKQRRRELIAAAGLSAERPEAVPTHHVESVNSQECIDLLATERPDVVVVNGTRIISAKVLAACDAVFLNTHCGITPAYRGVHGGYWALFQNDAANAGTTVHLVNQGIDTGDIVYQQRIDIDAQDNFLTYPVKQYIVGIPLMRRALDDVRNNRLRTTSRGDLPSALWLHPTLWQYLGARLFRGVR